MESKWIGYIISFLVLLLLFAAGAILWNPIRLLVKGKITEGSVVEIKETSTTTSEQKPLQKPVFEFISSSGERIKVTSRSSSTTANVGDKAKIVYNPSNPRDAEILQWKEFLAVIIIMGFALVIIAVWIAAILISDNSTLDDPFNLLPKLIAQFRLNKARFPVLFILTLTIPICVFSTFIFTKNSIDLKSNGIKVIGEVIGSERLYSTSNDRRTGSGIFPLIRYKDLSGTFHTIHRATAKPFSRLKEGDKVEVIYPVQFPNKGVVNCWDELWLGSLFFGFTSLAFICLLGLILNGSITALKKEPINKNKPYSIKVPAIVTIIEANPQTGFLHYRVDKEPYIPSKNLKKFNANETQVQKEIHGWKPTKAQLGIKSGDQFHTFLDLQHPTKEFFIDFKNKIQNNSPITLKDNENFKNEKE